MRPREEDLTRLQGRLQEWLRAKMPEAPRLTVSGLKRPSAGLSNETFVASIVDEGNGAHLPDRLVFRLAPTGFQVFPDYDLPKQYRIMRALAGTDVPVPEMRWLEEDEEVMGRAFYVMDYVEGELPSEVPPYHAFGMCLEASPERRAKLWWSGLATLARIHALDWQALGLSFVGVPTPGSGAITDPLDSYERFMRWGLSGQEQPILEAALRWLRANAYTPGHVALCWGDARLPNLIYRDDHVAAVLDWEMAFIGDPEADLAWWLFLDWQGSDGYGIPRLDGFPNREETVRRYEELTGHRVENLTYQEVFAAFRFGAVMARIAEHMQETGVSMARADLATNNPCTQRLAMLLDLPPPGEGPRPATQLEEKTVCVQFHLTGDSGCDWYLLAERGTGQRIEGTVDNPDAMLTATAEDWRAVRNGELDRTQAFMSGRLKVEGDITLLMQLEDMISKLGA